LVHVRCFVRDWLVHAEGIKCGVWVAFRGYGGYFYEGVKDFVGKDGMVIEVVAGCVFDVYMESFNGVYMRSFLLVM
jgi:hypothetical protein